MNTAPRQIRRDRRCALASLAALTWSAGFFSILFAATPLVGTANAQGRPDTRDYTCDEARNIVREEGAVVFTTGPNTYSRFVDHLGLCFRVQVTRPQFAPTIDDRQCFVGYECIDRMPPIRP